MQEVFVEGLTRLDAAGSRCYRLHRVELRECLMSRGDGHVFCRFSAPDAESVRVALRATGQRYDAIWSGRRVQGATRGSVRGVMAFRYANDLADPGGGLRCLDILRDLSLLSAHYIDAFLSHGCARIVLVVPKGAWGAGTRAMWPKDWRMEQNWTIATEYRSTVT